MQTDAMPSPSATGVPESGAHPDPRLRGRAGTLDAGFARAMLDQSVTLFLAGEPEAARLILRDLVMGTMGFDALAVLTHRSARSLRAMLTCNGKPGMDSLSRIFRVLRDWLQVRLDVRVVQAL